MGNDEICGEEYKTRDGVCDNPPSYPDGKCGVHSEEGGVGRNADGTATNYKHGAYAEPSLYYKRLPDQDQALVDAMVDSWLERAPFDESHEGNVEILRQVAIDWHKRRQANEYLSTEGITKEEVKDYYGEYGEVREKDEHHLHITVDRLGRSSIRILKELGVLDDPQSQKADAQETVLEVLAEAFTEDEDE